MALKLGARKENSNFALKKESSNFAPKTENTNFATKNSNFAPKIKILRQKK